MADLMTLIRHILRGGSAAPPPDYVRVTTRRLDAQAASLRALDAQVDAHRRSTTAHRRRTTDHP